MQLDIAFSDHNLSVETLAAFGEVVQALASHSNEPGARFWAFIKFVSDQHGSILHATPPPEWREKAEHVLSLGPLPAVNVEESPQAKMKKEIAARSFEVQLPKHAVPVLIKAFGAPRLLSEKMPVPIPVSRQVEVRLRDGRVLSSFQLGVSDEGAWLARPDKKYVFEGTEVAAVREVFGLTKLFKARPWVEW